VFFRLCGLLDFCSCGCFFFCILNVVAVGDSELEEAAGSVLLCFFTCPWSSAVVYVFFSFGILNVFVVGDSELEEAAGSVLLCFFPLSLEFCSCGCFCFPF